MEEDKPSLEKALPKPGRADAHTVFTQRQKIFIVILVAWGAFFSPVSASIYFPALNTLAVDFDKSNAIINLTITSYMVFQGLSPTVFSDLAGPLGKRPTYIVTFIIYLAANIGLALQNSYVALLVLRAVQSTGSSGTVALAFGVVSDIAISSERGTFIGIAASGALIGPAIGPVIGGLLSQYLGWRSIFWFLTIFGGVFTVVFAIALPETGRAQVGNGSVRPPTLNKSPLDPWFRRHMNLENAQQDNLPARVWRFPNPLKVLIIAWQKDVGMVLLYNALLFAAFYDIAASLPSIFAQIYGFNDVQIGLCYLPFGVGTFLGALVVGRVLDYNYRRLAGNAGMTLDLVRGDDLKDFPIERARLQIAFPLVFVAIAATFSYGWAVNQNAPLAAPLVLLLIIGLTLTGTTNILQTMLVDQCPKQASTVSAASNLTRCLLGAGATAVVEYMILAMGRGGCFSFVAAIMLLFSPLLFVLQRRGPAWREERRSKEAASLSK